MRHARPSILPLLAVLVCSLYPADRVDAISEWRIDLARSKLGFVAYYENIPFTAYFKDFSARIVFDPTASKEASFDAKINIGSVDSDSADRDEGMLEAAWFDAKRFPVATFITSAFTTGAATEQFHAHGRLSIKGTTQDVTLPFTWTTGDTDKSARLTGEIKLKRNDFSIGSGEWATDSTIGFDVKVFVDLYLQQR